MPSSSTLLSSSTSSTNTLNTLNTSTGGGVGSKGYQSGYMMGTSLSSGGPQESDEPLPTVSTKAKMNSSKLDDGKGGSRWGMDSMFDYAGMRAEDEDAPPMMSVNDIPSATGASSSRLTSSSLLLSHSSPPIHRTTSTSSSPDPSYIIVFGYPPDKYAPTLDFFLSLSSEYSMSTNAPSSAGTTQPESLYDVGNAFKLGYTNPADAVRALRKNGDVIRGGSGAGGWMVGVKWADASANISSPPQSASLGAYRQHQSVHDEADNMDVDAPGSVGTPIKLARRPCAV
ncbi:hypothetical protein BDZ89DRAFT_1078553 [Hymenopellis radicata]|nr:hypothetical protein BDZ89DRAFT_1078553 [Hymenopellis radicata]